MEPSFPRKRESQCSSMINNGDTFINEIPAFAGMTVMIFTCDMAEISPQICRLFYLKLCAFAVLLIAIFTQSPQRLKTKFHKKYHISLIQSISPNPRSGNELKVQVCDANEV